VENRLVTEKPKVRGVYRQHIWKARIPSMVGLTYPREKWELSWHAGWDNFCRCPPFKTLRTATDTGFSFIYSPQYRRMKKRKKKNLFITNTHIHQTSD